MSIRFYFSYKIEPLFRKLAENTSGETSDPFRAPIIIVPNINVLKWVQMTYAKSSVFLNLDLFFLENGIVKILSDLDAGEDGAPVFLGSRENHIEFQIMIMSALLEEDEFHLFNEYLGKKNDPDYAKRLWQLSDRLTKYFREYEYQREDMISKWEKGILTNDGSMIESDQCKIYRRIFSDGGLIHKFNKEGGRYLQTLPGYAESIFEKLKKTDFQKTDESVHIFGFSQISGFHYRILLNLSRYMDIYIYQLSFINDLAYINGGTGDCFSRTRISHNDLLGMWIKPASENSSILHDLIEKHRKDHDIECSFLEEPVKRRTSSLLDHLQNGMTGGKLFDFAGHDIKQDGSIRIFGCPDIYRETETVYNSIIYNMKTYADLKLTDIAVFVTDMGKYKNVLKSVFLNGGMDRPEVEYNSKPLIPFNLTDSNADEESSFGKALLKMLALPENNFSRKDVFDLIMDPVFLSANGIDRRAAVMWLEWINDLNVIQGYDNESYDFYSWQQGFKRLRFGRIMKTGDDNPDEFRGFNGIVPYANVDSENISMLNRFDETVESVLLKLKRLERVTLSGSEWASEISSLVNGFLRLPDEEEQENYVTDNLLKNMEKLDLFDEANGGKEPLTLPYIVEFVKSTLSGIPGTMGNYLTDGVTISSLIPLRPIPFRIVYIMGLDENLFPGFSDNSTLDLRNLEKMTGDISIPEANKYLFLETIMSARDKLYLSYVSRDNKKDEDLLPSSVINQLMDHLENRILKDKFKTAEIPLKGYSGKYLYEKNRIEFPDLYENNSFCYNLLIFKNLGNLDIFQKNMVDDAMSKVAGKHRLDYEEKSGNGSIRISINDLASFINNPVDALVKWNFKFYDEEEDKTLVEREPFYSEYPVDSEIINKALDYYVSENNPDNEGHVEGYFNDYYDYSLLKSRVPAGDFANVDRRNLYEKIAGRIDSGGDDLKRLLLSFKNLDFYKNIMIGGKAANNGPNLPAVKFMIKNSEIILTGGLDYLWVSPTQADTLILANSNYSNRLSKHVIKPFLFYLLILCVNDKTIFDSDKSEFKINISYKPVNGKSIYRVKYKFDKSTAYEYLKNLTEEFLFGKKYDLLPFPIISKIIGAEITPESISKQKIEEYIEDNDNSDNPVFWKSDITELINPSVPRNAFELIKNRYGLLYDNKSVKEKDDDTGFRATNQD
jgi:exodeoxyribonuclease V gamma subunit